MKRIVAMLLAVCMILCQMPLPVHAAVGTYTPPENNTDAPWFSSGNTVGFVSGETESGSDAFGWNVQTSEFQGYDIPAFAPQTATEQDTGAELQSDGSLTVLTVSGVDALTNPVGDGWSFDAETATLTLSGATITGDEQGFGIHAVGDLKILLAEGTENIITNFTGYGILVEGALTLEGDSLMLSSLSAESAAIYTITGLSISNCTNLMAETYLVGILSEGPLSIDNSTITVSSGIYAIGGTYSLNITNSHLTVDSQVFGLMSELTGAETVISESTVSVTCGVYGIMSRSSIYIQSSDIDIQNPNYVGDVLANSAEFPPSGILVIEEGTLAITDSSVSVSDCPYALGAQITQIQSSCIDVTNCICGIAGIEEVVIQDCDGIRVITGEEAFLVAMEMGAPVVVPPGAISVIVNSGTITNCTNVEVHGCVAGILTDTAGITLQNSDIIASGGSYGIAAAQLSIDDCNLSAHATWSAEEAQAMNGIPQTYAIVGLNGIVSTNCTSPEEYVIAVDEEITGFWTFMDTQGNVLTDVELISVTFPLVNDHLEVECIPTDCCVGDEINWDALCVFYVFSDGTRQQLSSSLLEFPEVDTSTPGAKEVTATYNGMSVTFTLPVHSGHITQTINPEVYPESAHEYENNMDDTQTLLWNGARSLTVTFSQETYTEPGCNLIYIYDSNGNEIACYTGSEAAGQTLTIPGDTIRVCLDTDGSVTFFGYSFDSITAELLEHTGNVVEDGHEPTCTEPGTDPLILCDICGQYAAGNPYAPALGHDYESVVTEPTPDVNGYTTHTCTRCGDSYTDSITIYGAIDGGPCGENVQWALTEDYELVIFGEGAMDDYGWGSTPWYEYREQITSIIVDSGITRIGKLAFENCISFTQISLPDTLESIGAYAFESCTSLESVSIPDSVVLIESSAFSGCTGMTDLELSDQLLEIQDNAFFFCDSLTQVTIPASVTTITENPFRRCQNLTEILVEEGNGEFCSEDGVLYDLYQSVLVSYPCGKAGHFTVPDTVTVLADSCFGSAEYLTSVDLPENLRSIGIYVFTGCISLETIRIPDSVTDFGQGMFQDCRNLREATLPSGLTTIPVNTFAGCHMLESISIPDSVISIEGSAFSGCTSLTHLTIPASVAFLADYAFSECGSLTSVEFLGDAPQIDSEAFYGVTATIAVPDNNATWTGDMMQSYGGNLNWVVRGEIIGLELRSVPDNTFVLVGESLDLKGIGVYVTYDNGTGEVLPAELLTCEADTSEPGIKTATVSYGGFSVSFDITVHGGSRMELDPSEYPESEHNYSDYLNDWQTVTIPGADSIVLEFSGKTYTESCDYIYIYDVDDSQIAVYSGDQAAGIVLEVPGDTVHIQMTSDGSITYYGYSFDRISGLMLEHDLETLPGINPTCTEPGRTEGTWCTICQKPAGEDASILLPPNGHQYEEERIPTTSEGIGQIIYTCISCGHSYREDWDFAGEGTCGDGLSWAVEEQLLFFMGSGMMADFADPAMDISGASPWYQHRNLFSGICWTGAVHNIGAYALSGSGLTSVTVPSSVTRIGKGAFSNSTALVNATLTAGVMFIGEDAFAGCSALSTVTIPSTVVEIGENAFRGCGNVTIRGVSGSVAETYANAHGIPFEAIPAIASGTYGDNISWIVNGDNVLVISGEGEIQKYTNGYEDYPWHRYAMQIRAIVVKEGITSIPMGCFSAYETYVEYISIPASVEKMDSYAWPWVYTGIRTLNVANVESWLQCEFGDVRASGANEVNQILENGIPVTDIVIPEGVTTLPGFLFTGYKGSFDSVTIPASLEAVYRDAFEIEGTIGTVCAPSLEVWCQIDFNTATSNPLFLAEQLVIDGQVITDVVIPDTITELGDSIFSGYDALQSVVVPSSVTEIAYAAFSQCNNLSTVVLPDTLTRIGDYAFSESNSLVQLELPGGITSIGSNAFYRCRNLNSITLPGNLTEIGAYAFFNCLGFREITIPVNVSALYYSTFSYCYNLSDVYFLGDAPEFSDAFIDVTATVHYPAGNETWTEDVMQDYGGNLTWVPYTSDAAIAGGECGENLVWRLSMDGVLTIAPDKTGLAALFASNAMYDYEEGYPGWYQYESRIRSIVVEDGVSYIGAYAFSNLTGVTSAAILGKTEIGEYAFYGCPALTELTMDRVTALNAHAFSSCTALTSFRIPSSLVRIEPCALYNCSALTDLTVGQGNPYFYVYNGMLYNSSTKTLVLCLPTVQGSVKISNNTKAVDPYAFASCSGITEVQIPASVADIGEAAFVGCRSLSRFVLLGENPVFSTDGVSLLTDSGRKLIATTNHAADYAVPEGVEEIATYAFSTSDGPVSLTLPEGVVTLADHAFAGCRNLETIHLPSTLKSIGFGTFRSCTSLRTVNLPEGLTAIGTNAFLGCNSLTGTLRLPGTVTDWGAFAFTGLPLTEVIIGYGLTDLGEGTFYGCSDLTAAHIPNTVTEFGVGGENEWYDAFSRCGDLVIYAHEGSPAQEYAAERGFGFEAVECSYVSTLVEPTCTSEGYTLHTCIYCGEGYRDGLVRPAGHSYRRDTCEHCGHKLDVIVSGYSGDTRWMLTDNGVLTIYGEGNMKNYTGSGQATWYPYQDEITHVVVEDGVTRIGNYTFYGMEFTSIEIADSVAVIGTYAFKNCTGLSQVELPSGLTQLGESAFYGCTALGSIEIPASLWTIQPYTFKGCSGLSSVVFNEGNLQKISNSAFYGTGLTELVLPDCLDILDLYAFKNCHKLSSITIGSGLTELREAVFYGTAISEIRIPEGITKIGPYAFKGCTDLVSIDLPDTLTCIGESAFYGDTALWVVELPDSVVTIDSYAFRLCSGLTTLTFGAGLETIGECAFYGCTALKEVILPDQVTTIKPYAFKGCTSLASVTFGNSLRTLDEGAFHTCTALKTIVFPASLTSIGAYCFSGSENLWKLTFQGDAPTIGTGAFKTMVAYAYYPSGNTTWTTAVQQNYGGKITWNAK